jgi:hypothetical protein
VPRGSAVASRAWPGGHFSPELLANARTAGTLHYLELQARRIVTGEVNRNLRNADRRGAIGFIDTIDSDLNLRPENQKRHRSIEIIYSSCFSFSHLSSISFQSNSGSGTQ